MRKSSTCRDVTVVGNDAKVAVSVVVAVEEVPIDVNVGYAHERAEGLCQHLPVLQRDGCVGLDEVFDVAQLLEQLVVSLRNRRRGVRAG